MITIKKIINKILLAERKTFKSLDVKSLFFFGKCPKILLLRQDRLGDLLVSTSFIRVLRQHLPSAEIDILLSKSNIQAKKCVEKYINKIWVLEKSMPKYFAILLALRRRRYDLIVDMFDIASTTSGIIIRAANPVFALGIDKSNSFIYDYTVPMLDKFEFNIVQRVCNLLVAFGINPQEQSLRLEYPTNFAATNTNIRFGINIAGVSASRFWGERNNLELILWLTKHYPSAEIQVFWTPNYEQVVKNLHIVVPNIIIEQYDSFDTFATAVSKCNYIISPDTSVIHLCAAFSIPVVALYLVVPQMPHSPWYPYLTPHVALQTAANTLEAITTEEVFAAIEKLVDNY